MREHISCPDEFRSFPGEIPVEFVYTAGVAGEKFFREIKENGRLLAATCRRCGVTYLPPMIYCERCFTGLTEFVPVPAAGVVHTFTAAHIDIDNRPLPEPLVYAFVKIDGTDGGLVHLLGGVKPEEVHIGLRVRAVFKEKHERTGSILDIRHFAPA